MSRRSSKQSMIHSFFRPQQNIECSDSPCTSKIKVKPSLFKLETPNKFRSSPSTSDTGKDNASAKSTPTKKSKLRLNDDPKQMILDAGQKQYFEHCSRLIVGLALVDSITEALVTVKNAQGLFITPDTTPVEAHLGVDRIWVHPDWRRRQIASALLQAARNNIYLGHSVPLNKVAFTQPTLNGWAFATQYTNNRKHLLLYEFANSQLKS